ncbi:MAG: flagellar biosis protein [Bacillus sp. (in: firmicutes)]|jgi:flagellar protein FliO/FliZ|nr:flagellar biosis protein [Bacillus sp. (in: firmicutes)]
MTVAKASERTVYEKFEKKSQQENKTSQIQTEVTKTKVSVVPYVLKFTGSFLLIIALLFFIQKYVTKKRKMYQGGGPFHGIGGHSLGNNRSMQLLMIGDTLYILGVGENVNLIRSISPGAEQTKLLEAVAEAETPVDVVTKWGKQIKRTSQEKWNDLLIQQLKEQKPKSNQNLNQTRKGELD